MQNPYEYDRLCHLPSLIRVKMDWLNSNEAAMGDLILQRLRTALAQAQSPIRILSLEWAIEGEIRKRSLFCARNTTPIPQASAGELIGPLTPGAAKPLSIRHQHQASSPARQL